MDPFAIWRKQSEAIIQRSPFKAQSDAILAALAPTVQIGIKSTAVDDLAPGQSRYNGSPDLPPGFDWPTRRKTGPLAFLTQINCAELGPLAAPIGLPDKGWFYVFLETVEQSGWGYQEKSNHFLVTYHDGDANDLVRTPPPDGTHEEILAFSPRSLSFCPSFTLPETEDPRFETLGMGIAPDEEDERDDYEGLLSLIQNCDEKSLKSMKQFNGYVQEEEISAHQSMIKAMITTQAPEHRTQLERWFLPGDAFFVCTDQLGGYPQSAGCDVRYECQQYVMGRSKESERRKGLDDWVLLWESHFDENLGWRWGDLGQIYVMIRKQDLAARDFSKTVLTMECG